MTNTDNPEHDSGCGARSGDEGPGSGAPHRRFPIVGIGASAGGLDALRTLFQAMPGDTGMGFVVIQHLDASHPSLLSGLLSKVTLMPVRQVENGLSVEPDHVYVIPPNAYMTISDGILLLRPPSDARGMRMPIDRFLSSLAGDQHEQAIGIILSGTGADGTMGVREVKANGGMVMVQDPETAQYDGMPRSAVATGQADAVLSLERMSEILVHYSSHAYVRGGSLPLPNLDSGQDPLTAILSLLLAKTGHDFRSYKKGTLVRRIHRRMGIEGVERAEKYLDLLRARDEEVRSLSKDLLIGVTSFFRETDAWSAIAVKVVGPIAAVHPGDGPVRVWVPGCATGEEAYTLAMLFVEAFERAQKNVNLLVFATDVDADALQVGRSGCYQENIAENLSPERLSRFFSREGDHYRVNKSLRDLVVFTPQNLIADPPFSRLDLISCRNLLIYLESLLQQKVLRLFHFALKPGGFLVLGSSEGLGSQQREFRTLSKKWRIFQPEGTHSPPVADLGQGPEAEIVRQLEDDLNTTREELQSTIEELETSNEELKALNEEVMSMNEELQSSNEELETSKEELQSINEELTTVNNQLQHKIVEVESANNDLSNLLSSTNIATLFLDRDLCIKRFTPATTRLMNLIPSDIGRPMVDIASNYAENNLPEDCRKALESLLPVERELLGEGGAWYIRRVQPYRTQDNRIEGTVITFFDVTAMKRRDEEQARLASIVESSENAIIGITLDGIVTSWNTGAEATCGYGADEMVGRSLDPLFPGRDHDELRRALEEVRAGRRVGPYEAGALCKDDTEIQLSVSISPIRDAAGRVIAASTIAHDITERKLAETALRERVELQDQLTKVAATVPGMICSYRQRADGSACMPYASPAVEDLLGVEPEGIADDFGPVQVRIHPEDADQVRETIEESARAMMPWRDTFRYRHPTKGEVWIEGHSVPSREADGSILWHGYVQDITERKRVEQELLDADRKKNQFLAVLGHELRNPLAPIRNAARILAQQDVLPDTVRWAVDLIARQSQQLERLVNDLLDVARISGLRVQLRLAPVVVQDALEDALLSAAPLMEQCKQELETRLPKESIVVMADPVRLAQVFTNLLRNAVKYTPDGGHIRITLTQEGQDAVVRVWDDGIGIRPEYLPRLFDFFSRGETEHPNIKDADGLGVGLALSKQLVERHQGTLEGHSSGPGLGSEFVVTLPVSPEMASTEPLGTPKPDAAPQSRVHRILVVDDNPDVADSFRVLLEAMGHRVRAMTAGADALSAISVFHPDVVFLDIVMPDMDGFQVAAAIRATNADPQPFLVALTGYSQDGDRQAAYEAGFDHHLLKPPDPEQIEALLAEIDL